MQHYYSKVSCPSHALQEVILHLSLENLSGSTLPSCASLAFLFSCIGVCWFACQGPEGPGISEAIAKKTEPQDGGASRAGREPGMFMSLSRELRVPSVLVDAISSS